MRERWEGAERIGAYSFMDHKESRDLVAWLLCSFVPPSNALVAYDLGGGDAVT